MGRAKRNRKIRSGKKMVRVALCKQGAIHAVQMAATIAGCRSTIGIIQAQKMPARCDCAGSKLKNISLDFSRGIS